MANHEEKEDEYMISENPTNLDAVAAAPVLGEGKKEASGIDKIQRKHLLLFILVPVSLLGLYFGLHQVPVGQMARGFTDRAQQLMNHANAAKAAAPAVAAQHRQAIEISPEAAFGGGKTDSLAPAPTNMSPIGVAPGIAPVLHTNASTLPQQKAGTHPAASGATPPATGVTTTTTTTVIATAPATKTNVVRTEKPAAVQSDTAPMVRPNASVLPTPAATPQGVAAPRADVKVLTKAVETPAAPVPVAKQTVQTTVSAPQAPAAVTEVVSVKTTTSSTKEIKQLEHQLADQKQMLEKMTDRMSAMQTAHKQTLDTLKALKEDMSQQVAVSRAQKEALDKVAAKKESKPEDKKVAAPAVEKPKKPVVPDVIYTVRAIVPGRAWLSGSDNTALTVRVGDILPGYGKIQLVDAQRGLVATSEGRVLVFDADDR